MYEVIQSQFFNKLYDYIYANVNSALILKVNDFDSIFKKPTNLGVDHISRGHTLLSKVVDLFVKNKQKLREMKSNPNIIKDEEKLNNFNELLENNLYYYYLYYINNKLGNNGVYSIDQSLIEIRNRIHPQNALEYKELAIDFIAKSKLNQD